MIDLKKFHDAEYFESILSQCGTHNIEQAIIGYHSINVFGIDRSDLSKPNNIEIHVIGFQTKSNPHIKDSINIIIDPIDIKGFPNLATRITYFGQWFLEVADENSLIGHRYYPVVFEKQEDYCNTIARFFSPRCLNDCDAVFGIFTCFDKETIEENLLGFWEVSYGFCYDEEEELHCNEKNKLDITKIHLGDLNKAKDEISDNDLPYFVFELNRSITIDDELYRISIKSILMNNWTICDVDENELGVLWLESKIL